MQPISNKVEIISYEPTGVFIKHIACGTQVKMSKRFFHKRIESGYFTVTNKECLPSFI